LTDEGDFSSEGISSEEIIRELKEVLKSELFKNSGKLSHLLEYVCKSAIAGEGKQLNEYLIGVEVFERKPDFSASADSIVRVRAHDLRRRLREYYSTEGKDHPIRIVLPKGSYCPEFEKGERSPSPGGDDLVKATQTSSTPELLPAEGKPGKAGFRSGPLFYVVAAILVLSLAGNFLSLTKSTRNEQSAAEQELSFYHELLGPLNKDTPRTTTINLSNPKVMFKFVSRSPDPESYLGREPQPIGSELGGILPLNADDSGIPHRPGDRIFHFLHITDDEYTGMGEASCAFHLARLFQRLNRPAQLSQARFLTWEKASTQDVIVLGQPLINIWAEKNLGEPNFSYIAARYRNRHPEPGEQTVYKCEVNGGSAAEGFIDYGLILMQRLANGARVLTLSGASSYGTLGTGEFFCDPVKMRPVYEALKKRSRGGAIPAEYEIFIKIVIKENIPVETTFVACRAGRSES